jgi:predicted DNA-binding antitoxin AbrB/MazE fold protein
MASVEAEYENGVLRPMKPLRLQPGERVHIIVQRQADASRWDLKRLANASHASDEEQELAAAGLDEWEQVLNEEDGH